MVGILKQFIKKSHIYLFLFAGKDNEVNFIFDMHSIVLLDYNYLISLTKLWKIFVYKYLYLEYMLNCEIFPT